MRKIGAGSPLKQQFSKNFNSRTHTNSHVILTGGNRQKLGSRNMISNPITDKFKATLRSAQIDSSSKDNFAIKALNISALSIFRTICAQHPKNKQAYLFNINDPTKPKEKGRKIYVSLYLHAQKLSKSSFFLDNGADISLIHETEIGKLLTPKEIRKYQFPSTHTVVAFNDEEVPILYDITLPWSHSRHGPTVNLTFSVYTQEKKHSFVLGQDSMELFGMHFGYAGEKSFAKITIPVIADLETRYEFPENIETCSATVQLAPHETKVIPFTPHPLSNIKKGEYVLISESRNPQIHVIPSRYKAYTLSNVPLAACVVNLSNKVFEGKVHAETEPMVDCDTISMENLESLPPHITLYQEALNYENEPTTMNILKITETLPETEDQVTPLTSFLIRTAYESNNTTSSRRSTPVQPVPESLHKFVDQTANPPVTACYTKSENKKLTNELQAIPFQKITNDTPPESVTDIPLSLTLPQGYEIPCTLPQTIEELLQLDNYEEIHQKYLKDIFIDTFPTVVSQHNYDVGNLSETLGYYKIQLKENSPLPPFKKMYYLAPNERQQLRDILDYLLKYNIIERATPNSDIVNLFASPAYLVSKPDKQSSARMIIDFRMLNEAILTAPPVIPNLPNTLQALRNKYMFSVSDFRQAYFSITLDPSSRALTRFVTDHGSFNMLKVPMGLSSSPSCWSELTHRMIHMRPRLDINGNPIFLEPNIVDVEHDHIPGCEIFYDDLIFATELRPTYAETVQVHYALIKRVIERLTFHKAKLSLNKSTFGKTHVKFLGWNVAHNTLFPDQKRVSKLLDSPFPATIQGMRAFLGLLQTIRTTLPCTFMRELTLLQPLCSSVKPYNPQPIHHKAFEKIKALLTETPIFSRIVSPSSRKLVFVDASEAGCYSAVLCQLEEQKPEDTHIPDSLSLADPVDRIIYDFRLIYEPVPLYLFDRHIPRSELPASFQPQPVKDISFLNEDFLGYSDQTVKNSLFLAIRSIQYAYGCQLSDPAPLRKEIISKLKTSLMYHRILESQFQGNKSKFITFLDDFVHNEGQIDDSFFMLNILANILNRPITVISTLPQHKGQEILKYVHHSNKPPFILGVYKRKNIFIFRPYYINRNSSFNLKEIANKFQIVSFHARAISPNDARKHIAEKELYAILDAMDTFSKLIGNSETICLTDSKALFLLFSNPVSKSVSKLARWGMKLHLTYPNLKFRFISTHHNLADYLSRNYQATKQDIKRLPLQNYHVSDLSDYIDPMREFTIPEWKDFVRDHEHLLTCVNKVTPSAKKMDVASLSKAANDMKTLLLPTETLQEHMTHQNIAQEQKKIFKPIYQKCLVSPNFTCSENDQNYLLSNGLILIQDRDLFKIYLPPSLEGIFLAYHHLSHAHAGVQKMSATLAPFYFPRKLYKIKHLCARCFPCALTNPMTRKHLMGSYPLANYMYETVVADLAESLPVSNGYAHILILSCPLTNFLSCYPLKNKTASTVAYHLQYGLFQTHKIKYFLADNGPCFVEKSFLTLLHTLKIQRIQISAHHPESNGKSESSVKTLKYLLKKTLSHFPDQPWTNVLPILIKQLNSTPYPSTGFSPLSLLHGQNSPSADSPFQDSSSLKLYPLLKNFKTQIQDKMEETQQITEFLKKEIQLRKAELQTKINKNRISTTYSPGDYCFTRDRTITLGVNPSLKTTYSDDPHVILHDRPTSVVTQRLGDSFKGVYAKDDVKKYNRLDAAFSHLPEPVRHVLVNKFEDLDKLDFNTIQRHAELPIPQSLVLQPDLLLDCPNEFSSQLISTENHPNLPIPTLSQTPASQVAPTPSSLSPLASPSEHVNKPPSPSLPSPNLQTKPSHRYNTRQRPKNSSESDSSDAEDTPLNKRVTFQT